MSPSRLADDGPVVLDASSGLNLLGTGRAADILRALPHDVLVTDKAAGEVGRDPLSNVSGDIMLGRLVAAGLVRVVPLSNAAYDHHLSLVGAPSPDGLDDGEAATVACAIDMGAVPILDERKATRIAASLCATPPVCTLDLLSHPRVVKEFGAVGVASAVHSALLHARMRVPEVYRPWILSILSAEKLDVCSSIPKRWLRASSAP